MSLFGSKKPGAIDVVRKVGALEEKKDVQGLVKLLRKPGWGWEAARALGTIGDPKAVGGLVGALAGDEVPVQVQAARSLGQIGDPKAVNALVTALADGSAAVRTHSADALDAIKDPRAVDALVNALLRDTDASTRFSAANALGALRDPRAVDALLEAFRRGHNYDEDGNTNVEWAAASSLGLIGGPTVVDGLIVNLEADPSSNGYDYMLDTSAELLGKLRDERAVEPLLAFVTDGPAAPGHKNDVLRALDAIGGAKADDFLDNTMQRPIDSVRGQLSMPEAGAMLRNAGMLQSQGSAEPPAKE